MNAAQKETLGLDLQKMVVGDLFALNPMMKLIVPDDKRGHTAIIFFATESSFNDVIANISMKTFDRDFSLDCKVRDDNVAVVRVRLYDPIIDIKGLL